MDFEIGFTPHDASLSFMFMRRAFECGEDAILNWRDPVDEWVLSIMNEIHVEKDPKGNRHQLELRARHAKESRGIDVENMLKFHRQSYYLMAFSLCESSTTKFAERYLRDAGASFKIRHFNGTGLERTKAISNAFNIDPSPFTGKRWSEVNNMKTLRNKLVHAGGLLEGDDSILEMGKMSSEWEGVEVANLGSPTIKVIELENSFVRHAIFELWKFTDEVAESFFQGGEKLC